MSTKIGVEKHCVITAGQLLMTGKLPCRTMQTHCVAPLLLTRPTYRLYVEHVGFTAQRGHRWKRFCWILQGGQAGKAAETKKQCGDGLVCVQCTDRQCDQQKFLSEPVLRDPIKLDPARGG